MFINGQLTMYNGQWTMKVSASRMIEMIARQEEIRKGGHTGPPVGAGFRAATQGRPYGVA
ncbi:MAG: hypothetical protein ACI4PT_01330 [Candidatus Avoscillospira sp.]